MTRRQFLKIAALAAASGAGASVAHAAPRRLRLTRHRVASFSPIPLRIAHLTDLHVGWGTPTHLLEQCVHLCQQARPDLVALTGDYLNRSLKHLPELVRLLARLPRPCVATLGNHDHWSGADAIQEAIQGQGVVVLNNASSCLSVAGAPLTIVGVDDGFTRRDDVAAAFSQVHQPQSSLILTHFPDTAREIARRGGRLILAGHTHGGQINVPLLTHAMLRLSGASYTAGWFQVGDAQLYVNVGVGSSAVRLRLGEHARPEIALIDLVPATRPISG